MSGVEKPICPLFAEFGLPSMHQSSRPLLSLSLLFLGACSQHLIPNTDVEDTAQNRDLVQFCEEYRRAVELQNIDELMTMAHPDYYEDGGNIDATDDLDYAGLRTYLEGEFKSAQAIRYEMHYRRVFRDEDRRWNVAYTYTASYRLPDGDGDRWHREVAENQLTLQPTEDGFLILAGM